MIMKVSASFTTVGSLTFATVFLAILPLVYMYMKINYRKMWEFLEMLITDLDKITQFVQDNQNMTKYLLKEAPNIMTWVGNALIT